MGKWSVERWLLVLTFLCSVVGFTFGLGVNYARITAQDATINAFEKTYLRADVYAADQRRLSESVDRLTRAIEQMQSQGHDLPPQRMFDR